LHSAFPCFDKVVIEAQIISFVAFGSECWDLSESIEGVVDESAQTSGQKDIGGVQNMAGECVET
jgi:hypothetical protein